MDPVETNHVPTPLHAVDDEGHTPLHTRMNTTTKLATLKTLSVRELLAEGASVDAVTKSGNTPLHYAAGDGYNAVVSSLLAAQASVEEAAAQRGSQNDGTRRRWSVAGAQRREAWAR